MRKLALLIIFTSFHVLILQAQSIKVEGRISTTDGEGLPGATVQVKGTDIGTITDVDGNYVVEVPSAESVLAFSFIGYLPEERKVGNNSIINVSLSEDVAELEEIVVIGYGSVKKSDLTGSVASVQGKNIKDMPVTGIDQVLQGRAAGVQVVNNSGAPGSGVSIMVRGVGTVFGSSEPLYIIDGVPLNNNQITNAQTGQNGDAINPMSSLNPSDIESIEVLKDPASTAIYGARGANGVVLITTKRGSAGKPQVEFNGFYGWSEVIKTLDVLDSHDYKSLTDEGLRRIRVPEGNPLYLSQDEVDRYNTDWQDEIFRKAPTSNYNLSVRGGNEFVKYMFSGGYFNTEGVVINTGFERYSFRANLDVKINNKITAGFNLNPTFTQGNRLRNSTASASVENNKTTGGPIVMSALLSSPAYPVYDEFGNYAWDLRNGRALPNPVMLANEFGLENNSTRLIGNAYVNINIFKGLDYKANFGVDLRRTVEDLFVGPIPYPVELQQSPGEAYPASGRATNMNNSNDLTNFYQTLSYQFKVAEGHDITVLAGYEEQNNSNKVVVVAKSGFTTDKATGLSAGNSRDQIDGTLDEFAFRSFFGRLNYSFQDGRYLLQGNVRYDGSSRFGAKNRYGFFPAVSVGWNVARENFMSSFGFLDDLKLRFSMGVNGNSQLNDNYAHFGSVALSQLPSGQVINYLGQVGAVFIVVDNDEFSWEEHHQKNLGLDVGLFGNRVNISADVYRKNIQNLLFPVELPRTSGMSQAAANVGELRNQGFELAISTFNITNSNFEWTTSLNLASSQMEVVNLFDDSVTFGNTHLLVEGEPVQFYTYKRQPLVDSLTGWVVLQDLNEDGSISYGGGRSPDKAFTGSPLPKLYGGISNTIKAYGFDLSAFFQFSYGNKIYNATRQKLEDLQRPPGFQSGPNTTQAAFDNMYSSDNPVTAYPVTNYNGISIDQREGHDGWIEDGSYLRLKTLTLGYTLPSSLLDRAGINTCRVYFTSNNLLTWTNYSGFDPEVSTVTGSAIQQGIDAGAYPQSKTLTLGINMSF